MLSEKGLQIRIQWSSYQGSCSRGVRKRCQNYNYPSGGGFICAKLVYCICTEGVRLESKNKPPINVINIYRNAARSPKD